MEKTIYPEQGFRLSDIMSKNGEQYLEMTDDFFGIDEDNDEFSRNVFMSNDEMLKFLNMSDMDSDDEEEGTALDSRMPWNLSFDKLRLKMTDLLGNGEVMKFLKKQGDGKLMADDAQVSVRYIAYFEHQDEPFDASYCRGSAPEIIQLGQGAVLLGLEIALRSMLKNEVSAFLIKPEYAYGEMGIPPRIPPNQEVLFVVHLKDYVDDEIGDSFRHLSNEEKKLFCNLKRNVLKIIGAGFDNFKKGKMKQAIGDYTKAAKVLEGAHLANEEEEDEQKKLLTRVYGNLTICYNKENKPRCACSAFNQIPTRNAKAYFNHGRALIRLGEFQRAKEELLTSREMEPKNKVTLEELALLKKLISKYNSIKERLKTYCFLSTGAEFVSPEFESAAQELCLTIQNDDNVLRLVLPDGLTKEEDQCFRGIAVKYDLSIVNHMRYGHEIVFLAKPNY